MIDIDIYEEIFKGTDVAMIVYTPLLPLGKFIFKDINPAAEDIIGRHKEDVLNKALLDVLPNLRNTEYYKMLNKVASTSKSEKLPLLYYKDEVVEMWRDNFAFKVSSGDIVVVLKDITEKVNLSDRLNNLSLMFENTKDIMIFLDEERKVIDVNNTAVEAYGYSKQELVGKDASIFRAEEEIPLIDIQMRDIMTKGAHFESIHKRKNGEKFPVEVSSIARKAKDGKVVTCSIIRDISARKEAQKKLIESEERYRTLFEFASDIIFTIDAYGNITSVNRTCEKLSGFSRDKLLEMNIFEVTHEECHEEIKSIISKGDNIHSTEAIVKFVSSINRIMVFHLSINTLKRENGEVEFQIIGRDITEARKNMEDIKYEGTHDDLTGLYNRTFYGQMTKDIEKEFKLPISVIMADINGLKLVNDSFGHSEGDNLIKTIASIITRSVKENSYVIRTGGDEFVILSDYSDEKSVESVLRSIKEKCSKTDSLPIKPNVSMGYAIMRNSNEKIDEVLEEAEKKMYSNKLAESRKFRSSIVGLLRLKLKNKFPEINEHSIRVKDLAVMFAKSMNMEEHKIEKLEIAAEFHDIGKIALNKKILFKGELTEDEEEELEQHCRIGYNIAKLLPEISSSAEIILCHHENWNGTGYPQNLKGEEIPKLSRVLSIVNVYDELIYTLNGGKRYTKAEALEAIIKESGKRFDPELVNKFIEFTGNKKLLE